MKKLVIEITNRSSGGSSSNSITESGNNNSKLSNFFNYKSTLSNYVKNNTSSTVFFSLQMGADLVKKTGMQMMSYYISDIGRANGDSNYQAIVNRRIEVATDALSVIQGAWTGAAAGSAIGPIGVAVGAMFGAASAGINLGFKYAERERAYQHELFLQNNSQAYQLARANFSANTGRVR